jgi:hypothetical protein
MGWFDRSGLLYSLSTDVGDALNGILNLSYLVTLKTLKGDGSVYAHLETAKSYARRVNHDGNVWSGVGNPSIASHDDVTGIVCVAPSSVVGKIKTAPYFYRWGEFVLYNYWMGRLWTKAFLWVLTIKLMFSCWRTYKADNGAVETDGKLLAWLIIESFDLRTTRKLCYPGIKHHFGENWLYEMAKIKYPDEDHPFRVEAQGWKKH